MAGTHTEAVFDKLTKPELFQLLFNTGDNIGAPISTLTAEIKDLNNQFKKVEADVAITKDVNSRQVEQLLQTERQYWENTQYSRSECLEVIEMQTSVKDNVFEGKERLGSSSKGQETTERSQWCYI